MVACVQVIAVFVQLAATVICFVADQQVETKMLAATPAIRGREPFARDDAETGRSQSNSPQIAGFALVGHMVGRCFHEGANVLQCLTRCHHCDLLLIVR
jgi:hypothetical protein